MGYFDKYKPYIWDNLDDNKKKEIAIFIFTNIANRLAELNVDTPDKYFSSFSSNDLGYVGELLQKVSSDLKFEGNNTDFSALENIITAFSNISLWKKIENEYKDSANIEVSLKGKEFECYFNVADIDNFIDDSLKNFFKSLDAFGISVVSKEIKEINNIEEFNKLINFYHTLKEQLVLEEVEQAASNLLLSLDVLYKNLFKSNYVGVLMPNGQLIYANPSKKNLFAKFLIEKETN